MSFLLVWFGFLIFFCLKRLKDFKKLFPVRINPKSIFNKANVIFVFMFAFQFLHLPTDNFSICFKPFSTYLIEWLVEIEMIEKEKRRQL